MNEFDLNNLDFLQSRMVLIYGLRGRGKTLLLTYLMQNAMLQSVGNILNVYDYIDYLNSLGYKFNKNFEHVVYTNYSINTIGCSIPNLSNNEVNPFYIGFSGKFKTIPFPPNTIFGITELQNYYPSQMNDYIRPEVLQYWQTSRHNGISLYADVQRPYDLAKKVRDLFDYFIECLDVKEIYKNGLFYCYEWTLRVMDSPRSMEKYLDTGNSNFYKEFKFRSYRYLYDAYDTYFCQMLHYVGFENLDFITKLDDKMRNVLKIPDGYFISKTLRAKSKNEIEEVMFL